MKPYALVTQIDDNLYEVFNILEVPEVATVVIDRIESAIASGKPITGLKTTHFGSKVSHGAIIDGENIIEAETQHFYDETDWSNQNSFSILCDNKVFLIVTTVKNTLGDDMHEAAFTNNVTLVKIDNIEDVKLGYLWNGESFIANEENIKVGRVEKICGRCKTMASFRP